ncbi:MATE family efflux transporter [Sphingomonas lacunae]|uniref:Multidrug-efflux transporter n=2 Tax=Sphingomonas lacunae TaxID=2698828 RepID=A0A6M4AQE0_9SPHN|nr:MATE family efflux transporter [Sphingomonas lacunae]
MSDSSLSPMPSRPVPAHGTMRELPALLRLAGPLAAANLLQMAVYAVDVIFVARLGAGPLAAASLGVSIVSLLTWSLSGLVGAAAPVMAAELGQRRHAVREVRRTMRMGFWLAFIAGAAAMLLCLFAEPFMLATGQPPRLAAEAGGFVHLLMWCIIPGLIASLLRIFVSAMGRATIAMVITLIALLVNALGNWLLVFGNAGFPTMGLAGSAVASIITNLVMVAAYVAVIQTDRRFRRFHLFGRWWRIERTRLSELFRIGGPIGLTILAEAGLFSGAAFLMGRIGEVQLAAHTVALQIAAIAFQVPFGVAQAATIRVGLAYGARDHMAIARAGRTALFVGIGFMAMTACAIWLFPRALVSIYVDTSDPANALLVVLAVQYLAVAAAFQLFDGAQAVGAGALRGLQDTRTPMIMAVSGYWVVGYGCAIWLGFFTPLEGLGVWIGLAAGLVAVSAMLLSRWSMRARLGLLPA